MRFAVLGSGSKGNSVYIEEGQTAILIDNGFSGKDLLSRLRAIGKEISDLSAVFVTHSHNDHIAGVGVVSRRCSIPVYANCGTFSEGENRLGKLHRRIEFSTGALIDHHDLQIQSFAISHDTADPVGYVISNGSTSIGYCTDTGKITHRIRSRLAPCNALILEFNHDPEMLKNGPYPLDLQQRIRSSHGHLANETSAEFLAEIANDNFKLAILAHLSETNNTPQLAHSAACTQLAAHENIKIVLAHQYTPTELFELE